ncbi:hypothetical protein GOP47_0003315 [Adiantum capillus-veneris]|uniref:Uncharacterized protein n=1 Tax=Adiantum capillus-veneris TaxID=13818 RepID=A0A9D4ZS52_ADICA|nr:hypothetical protein GOP47_0003315 [Adiantum capillus-veneris]
MAIMLLSHLPAKYYGFYLSLITNVHLNVLTWEELVPMVVDQEEQFQQQVKDGPPEALTGGHQGGPYKGKGRFQQQNPEGKEGSHHPEDQGGARCLEGRKVLQWLWGHYWQQCPRRGESSTTSSSNAVQ